MGAANPRLAIEKFNLSSFFQGIPGNDGIPGKPGVPGNIVSKIREKRMRGDSYPLTGDLRPYV